MSQGGWLSLTELRDRGVTRREEDVLRTVGRRLSNAEIAAELGISKRTVESHVSSLMSKLSAPGRASLVQLAGRVAETPGRGPVTASTATAHPPPVAVGREQEMAVLATHVREAHAGRGATVVVSGEPGVGKTRLVHDVVSEAHHQGFQCLVGTCEEADGAPPFGPVIDVLRAAQERLGPASLRAAAREDAAYVARLLPDLVDGEEVRRVPEVPPEQARRLIVSSVRDTLVRVARTGPLLVVLEDVHRADPATLSVLERLAARAVDLPLLVLATHRDAEADVWPDLGATLARLTQRHLVRPLVLARLDEEAVGLVLAARAGGRTPPDDLRRAVHRRTDGNPFYVEELITFLEEERLLLDEEGDFAALEHLEGLGLPRSIRIVVRHRLEGLPSPARAILETAALVGRTFGIDVLAHAVRSAHRAGELASDRVLDALDDAIALGLVGAPEDSDDDDLSFVHGVVPEVLAAGVSGPRRRQIHLRIAEAWIARGGDGAADRAARIAEHLRAAGGAADPALVRRYRELAAPPAGDGGARALTERAHRP